MAGSAATNKPVMPPAPAAEAWIMEFSWGPKPAGVGKTLVRDLIMPKPKIAPKREAPKVKPVLRPISHSGAFVSDHEV